MPFRPFQHFQRSRVGPVATAVATEEAMAGAVSQAGAGAAAPGASEFGGLEDDFELSGFQRRDVQIPSEFSKNVPGLHWDYTHMMTATESDRWLELQISCLVFKVKWQTLRIPCVQLTGQT